MSSFLRLTACVVRIGDCDFGVDLMAVAGVVGLIVFAAVFASVVGC